MLHDSQIPGGQSRKRRIGLYESKIAQGIIAAQPRHNAGCLISRPHTPLEKLCSICTKIPFEECLPGHPDDEGADRSGATEDALIFYISLSHILQSRNICKFCGLLFRTLCEPEYDLLKAQHVKEYLPDGSKNKYISSSEWTEKNTSWIGKWAGGAGLWPFGYAVGRQQAAKSTLQQAQTLFLEAEDRDINTKSLNMKELEDMYMYRDKIADTMAAANTNLAFINLVTNQRSEQLQKGMGSAQFVMGQLALLQSKKRKRLPCIFMLRAYRKHNPKKGALSVRVYGHG